MMPHTPAPLYVGIYTRDPVTCRVLRLLLSTEGYRVKCFRSPDRSAPETSGLDLLVMEDAMEAGKSEAAPARTGIPTLYLTRVTGQAVPALSSYLSWPCSSADLMQAIEAARRT